MDRCCNTKELTKTLVDFSISHVKEMDDYCGTGLMSKALPCDPSLNPSQLAGPPTTRLPAVTLWTRGIICVPLLGFETGRHITQVSIKLKM